ncbi:MAG: hypothetical protein ACKVX7_08560 [Planctomycetota bacterium]
MRSSQLMGVVVVAALALASCCTDRHYKVTASEFRSALSRVNKMYSVRLIGVANERAFLRFSGMRTRFCRVDDVWSVALDEFPEADAERLRRGEHPWSPKLPPRSNPSH